MSSKMRSGLSTLNRLLGKKNKDSSMSKSTSNLSTLDTSSQHNKIIPLAASNNAPFEQTFRITICLPRDQLFVVRVGAKTKLSQLLEMVCTNKQLDADKFEFRHPDGTQAFSNHLTIGEVGLNEIRLCDKTDKLESGAFAKIQDEKMRLHHQMSRESLSGTSDFSRNSNRQYSGKTTSPYSSTNSLSSIDSAGVLNSTTMAAAAAAAAAASKTVQTGGSAPTLNAAPVPVAPQRKKRTAPRPPSQNSIPESHENSTVDSDGFKKPSAPMALPRRQFHMSFPNLSSNHNNNNHNDTKTKQYEEFNNNNNNNITNDTNRLNSSSSTLKYSAEVHHHSSTNAINGHSKTMDMSPSTPTVERPMTMSFLRENGKETMLKESPMRHSTPFLHHSRTSSDSSEIVNGNGGPEPVPRKRTVIAAKKKAPAPPPRTLPIASPVQDIIEELNDTDNAPPPAYISSATTPTENVTVVMINAETPSKITNHELPLQSSTLNNDTTIKSSSDIILNDSPISTENNSLEDYHQHHHKMDTSDEDAPKVYNIQMGKPIVSSSTTAIPTVAATEIKQSTSPDNTEIVQNIKNENKEVLDANTIETKINAGIVTNKNIENLQRISEPSSRAESPLWTYTLPAPLKFADGGGDTSNATVRSVDGVNGTTVLTSETQTIVSDQSSCVSAVPDSPIRPIIHQRLPLDFQAFNDVASTIASEDDNAPQSGGYDNYSEKFSREALLESLERRRDQFIENEFDFLTKHDADSIVSEVATEVAEPIKTERRNLVLEELSQTLQNGPTLSRISPTEIETAGTNKLSNFTIQTYSAESKPLKNNDIKPEEDKSRIIPPVPDDVENIIRKHADPKFYGSTELSPSKRKSSITQITERSPSSRIIRSDSFHSTRIDEPSNGLTPRSLSYITLIGTQKFESNLLQRNLKFTEPTRRKSTSIADLPSLQSVEVMKSILSNSRKNSCTNITENGLHQPDGASVLESIQKEAEKEIVIVPAEVKDDVTMPKTIAPSDDSSSKENSPKNKVAEQRSTAPATAPVDGKQWRYQGPPTINLSTWSERPRKLVPIKTENDIRTQATIKTNPPVTEQSPQPPKTTPTDTTHLPIVLGVVKKASAPTVVQTPQEIKPDILQPSNRISYEISTLVSTEKPKGYMAERIVHNTMTLGRVPIPNRFSMHQPKSIITTGTPPTTVVSSTKNEVFFKVNSPVTTPNHNGSSTANSSTSSKDGDSDSGYKSMPAITLFNDAIALRKPLARSEEEKEFTPFSQLTLRKTGLKEKILADNDQNKSAASSSVKHRDPQMKSVFSRPVSMPVHMHFKPSGTTTTTKNNISLTAIRPTENVTTTATEAAPPPIVVQISPKLEVQQTNVVSSPPPPPPPTLTTMASIKAVSATKRVLPGPQTDPHDQLLDSIRNFSKMNLRKK